MTGTWATRTLPTVLNDLGQLVSDVLDTTSALKDHISRTIGHADRIDLPATASIAANNVLRFLVQRRLWSELETFLDIPDVGPEVVERIQSAHQEILALVGKGTLTHERRLMSLIQSAHFSAALRMINASDRVAAGSSPRPVVRSETALMKRALECLCAPRDSLVGLEEPNDDALEAANSLRAELDDARPLFRDSMCLDAERLVELQCYRLRLALLRPMIKRGSRSVATASPYQSVVHRLREGHPATAARIALIWVVALLCEYAEDPWQRAIPTTWWLDHDALLIEMKVAHTLLTEVRTPEEPISHLLSHFRAVLKKAIGTPDQVRIETKLPAPLFADADDIDDWLVRRFLSWRRRPA